MCLCDCVCLCIYLHVYDCVSVNVCVYCVCVVSGHRTDRDSGRANRGPWDVGWNQPFQEAEFTVGGLECDLCGSLGIASAVTPRGRSQRLGVRVGQIGACPIRDRIQPNVHGGALRCGLGSKWSLKGTNP